VEKRSHVAIWNWVQVFNPNKLYLKRTRVTFFIIDETMLQIGSDYAWLWVAIELFSGNYAGPVPMSIAYQGVI
jgi:putative transposase